MPSYSTLLQVLISIQALIFVEKPYYNEPGYERSDREQESVNYNKRIRTGTTKWAIIDMIKNPPPCFADVVRTHFRLTQDRVMETVTNWHGADHALTTQVKTALSTLTEDVEVSES